jgi:hypothetical protein
MFTSVSKKSLPKLWENRRLVEFVECKRKITFNSVKKDNEGKY